MAQADEIVVPQAVAVEVQAGPAADPARQLLAAGRFTLVDTPPPSPELLAWDLGSSETAVLALAIAEKGWTAILDDAAARKCAYSFSIPLKGTLAVVLLAKQRGLIDSAAAVLQLLIDAGFRLDERLLREVLIRTVGESWPS